MSGLPILLTRRPIWQTDVLWLSWQLWTQLLSRSRQSYSFQTQHSQVWQGPYQMDVRSRIYRRPTVGKSPAEPVAALVPALLQEIRHEQANKRAIVRLARGTIYLTQYFELLLTHLVPQSLELAFLRPALRPHIDHDTFHACRSAGTALRPHPITPRLAAATILTCETGLLPLSCSHLPGSALRLVGWFREKLE